MKGHLAMGPRPSTCKESGTRLIISRPVLGRPKVRTRGAHQWGRVDMLKKKIFDLKI